MSCLLFPSGSSERPACFLYGLQLTGKHARLQLLEGPVSWELGLHFFNSSTWSNAGHVVHSFMTTFFVKRGKKMNVPSTFAENRCGIIRLELSCFAGHLLSLLELKLEF